MSTLNKILLADDEADIRTICTLALESIGGFEVKTCVNGHGVLDNFGEFGPDMIVLDVMMPDLDGPGTLVRLKEHTATAATPVVFLTARNRPEDVKHYHDLGALAVVSKPFDPMTLPHTIQEIWNDYHAA